MTTAGAIRTAPLPFELAGDEPDAHLVLDGARGEPAARCSLWWSAGAIGHFSAADAASGERLLRAACARLADHGCARAVGPMDGSTWQRYRLVTERGEEPPFFLEPDTPDHWRECFARAGFSVLARYCSSVQDDLTHRNARLDGVARRAAASDVRIRAFDPGHAERDLGAMHALALEAFSGAFLFCPIERARFVDQYALVLPFVRPELVLLAEQRGKLVAFLFALPDMCESARGCAPRTLILKTVAGRRGRVYGGLGHLLVDRAITRAAALGFERAVHALMHEASGSRNWSARCGKVFRRYALLGRAL
ncbi:MAG: N-acetyltransferase [Betaproteobacteria bacterium]|nr:N-acetyltransferase [Betaproteobacteria bacterium]